MSGKDKKQKPRKHAVKQAEGVVDKTSKPAEQSAAIVKATASVDKAVSVPSKSAKDSKDKKRKQGKPVGTVTKKPSRLRFHLSIMPNLLRFSLILRKMYLSL